MKRKVIQIAESTQLISLPRKWCLQNNVNKGDELNVESEGDRLVVSCKSEIRIMKADLYVGKYGLLAQRLIFALYKKGVDEIKVHFDKPSDAEIIHNALKNETVGYEIIEQDSKSCLIKNISSNILGFDTMLRRTFLLLISLADESAKALLANDLNNLNGLLSLEESNNRFTTLCRRYLNKYETQVGKKVGPLYTIVEDLEKIADEYKYLIKNLSLKRAELSKVSDKTIELYADLHKMLQEIHHAFYKLEPDKLNQIAEMRKAVVRRFTEGVVNAKNGTEFLILHHATVTMQKIFNMIGPLLILNTQTLEEN